MDDNDLGPLPESDLNSVLQAESFRALENALPPDRFVLRDEPQPDAGVDKCIELRINGRFTGMRAHLQVKARAKTNPNADESISYAADVSNINYMLNGLSPIYVIYLADRKELRYAWIRDEVDRIQKELPDWKQQKTVTLRFGAALNQAGLEDIHERIRREARIDRQIHDLLSRANVTEKTLHINLNEAHVTDPDHIRDLLLETGLTLVSYGNPARVLELIDKVTSDARKLPKLLLVRAFAECSLSHYQMASGVLAEVTVRSMELSGADRLLLTLLRDTCDYQAGRLTRKEFIRRQTAISENDESEFGLSRRIASLWESLLEDGSREGIAAHLPDLRTIVKSVLAQEDCSDALRIQARTALLFGEGVELTQDCHRALATLKARLEMGRETNPYEVFQHLNSNLGRWTNEANALVRDAARHGNPHLIGDACYTRSLVMFVHGSAVEAWLKPDAVRHHFEHLKGNLIPDLQRAVGCYEHAGIVEWQLRAKLLLADVAFLTGDTTLANQMADEVLPIAEAYQFDKVVKEARDHLAGDPFFRQMQRKFLWSLNEDPDLRDAQNTDEQIRRVAERVLEVSDLASEKSEIMTRELLSLRDIARERVNWCRHIQLIQDLGHTRSQATYYASDPERFCYCEKFGVRSGSGSTDWKVLIETFKTIQCSTCSERSPKGRR